MDNINLTPGNRKTKVEWNADGSRSVHFGDAESELFRQYLEESAVEFEKQFGRPMGPNDPVFWDHDASTPMPLDAGYVKELMAEAMYEAGAPPAAIHATNTTGLMLTDENKELATPLIRDWWLDEAEFFGKVEDNLEELIGARICLVAVLGVCTAAVRSTQDAADMVCDVTKQVSDANLAIVRLTAESLYRFNGVGFQFTNRKQRRTALRRTLAILKRSGVMIATGRLTEIIDGGLDVSDPYEVLTVSVAAFSSLRLLAPSLAAEPDPEAVDPVLSMLDLLVTRDYPIGI